MEDILKGSPAIISRDIADEPAADSSKALKRGLPRFLKEPFLHFAILGVIIYVSADFIKERNDKNRFAINLSDEDVLRIASLWEKQYGTLPSKKQLGTLVDNYIREEVFYREGVAMELDKGDEVIRRRIAQKYEFLQEDLAIVDEPSERDLISYFEKNKELYRIPEKISFTHIFFSPDIGGIQQAVDRAKQTRQELISEHTLRAPDKGDHFPFLYDYSDLDETQLERLLGDGPLKNEAFALTPNEWSQPLQSGYGYHLVLVTEKKSSWIPDYSSVKGQLRIDFLEVQRQEKNSAAYEKLLRQYSIIKPEVHDLNP